MELRVLAVGDVVGVSGLKHLEKHLRSVKRLYGVDFCVVNGENASGVGLTPQQADAMLDAGADVITLGNHTWNRREICPYLDDSAYILRPANFQPSLPGRGWGIFETKAGPVVSVLGVKPEQSIALFRGELTSRYETAPGACKLCGAVFTINTATRLCTKVERVTVL